MQLQSHLWNGSGGNRHSQYVGKKASVTAKGGLGLAIGAALVLTCAHARTDSCESVSLCRSAVEVAQAEYRDFLARALTPYAKKMHGLAAEDGYQNATLGAPYVLHEILPEKVGDCDIEVCESLGELCGHYESYMFPVFFSGRLKLMMTVFYNRVTGRLEIGSLGDKWLAAELSEILKAWSEDGARVELYHSPEAGVWAFSVPSHSQPNLTLVVPAAQRAGDYSVLSPLADTARTLAERVADSQRGWYQ